MWLVRRAAEGWFVRFFWQCRRSGRRKVWPRQRRSKRLAKFLFNSDWWLINTDLRHCQSLYSPLMCICSVRPLTSLVQPVFSCFGLGWKVSLLYLRLLFKLWYKTMFFVSAPTPCKLESTATTCCGSTRATPWPPLSGEAQPRMPRLHMVGRYGHLLGWKGEGQIKCWLHRSPFCLVKAFQAKSWQKMLQTKSSYPLTWHGSLRVLRAIA